MDLKLTFENLCDDLIKLRHLVKSSSPRFACVSFIPHVLRGQENLPVSLIETQQHFGREAIDMAMSAWDDLHIKYDFSQKAARRMAGVIWYQPDGSKEVTEMVRVLEQINAAKADIEGYIIGKFTTRSARFEALRQSCPGVMTMHLYRQIRWWHDSQVAAVRFCWQDKESLLVPDKTALLARMGQDAEHSAEMEIPMSQLIQKVSAVPEDRLRMRRRLRVQPAANVTFFSQDDSPRALKTVTAPMPFIIIQQQRPEFKMLDSYSAASRAERKRRSDKIDTEIIGSFHGESIEMII